MKKANILVAIGISIAFAFLFFSEGGDKNIKAIVVVIAIGLGLAVSFSIMPKQEGVMKTALTLVKVGFAIALPGWLIAAFGGKAGAVLFIIGWLIGATGMVIAIWNNTYPSKVFAKAMKIILIGFGIFTGGVLLGAIGIMEEEKNIFSYVGIFISLLGFFVGFLAVIEDQMRGH